MYSITFLLKPTNADTNPYGNSRQNRGKASLTQTYPMMGESDGKCRKRYVDCLSGIIHSHGHYSDECKVLGDFGDKYVKYKPTKDSGNHTVPRNKFNKQQ